MLPLTPSVRLLISNVSRRKAYPRLSSLYQHVSRYWQVASRTNTQPAEVYQRFGSLKEERNSILDNFEPTHSVEVITSFDKAGYPRGGGRKLVDEVTKGLLRTYRFEEAVDFTAELARKGDLRIPQRTYCKVIDRFLAKRRGARRGSDIENQMFSYISFMHEQGYKPLTEQSLQIMKLAALAGNRQVAHICFNDLKVDDVSPKVDNVSPKVDDVSLKVEDVNPKVDDVSPKVDDVSSKVDDVSSKVEDVSPKIDDFSLKVEDGGQKFTNEFLDEFVKVRNGNLDPQVDNVSLQGLDDSSEIDDNHTLDNVRYGLLLQTYIMEARMINEFDNTEEMHIIFNDMVDMGFGIREKDVKMFIENSVRAEASEEARELILKMLCNRNMYLNYLDLLNKIHAHVTNDEVETALDVARKAKYTKMGFIDSLLNPYHEQMDDYLVSQVLDGARSSRDDATSSKSLISFQPNRAVETLFQLKRSGHQVPRIFRLAMEDLLSSNRIDDALLLMKEVVERRLLGDGVKSRTYTQVLRTLVQSMQETRDPDTGEKFYSLISFMKKKGYKTNFAQHFCIMRMSALVGNVSEAEKSFKVLKNNNMCNGRTYNLLLQAYINDARNRNNYDNMADVLRCFNEMADMGLQLNNNWIKLLIENSVVSGFSEEVRIALHKLGKNSKYCLKYLNLMARIRQSSMDGLTESYTNIDKNVLDFITLTGRNL